MKRIAASRTVVGIDVGTVRCGYCALDVHGQDLDIRVIESFAVRGATIGDRLQDLGRKLAVRLVKDLPFLVAVEDGYVGRNLRVALVMGKARGIAEYVAGQSGALVAAVQPAEARKAVGVTRFDQCRGAAKAQVQVAVCQILKLKTAPDNDAADAAALAVWAANRLWQYQPGLAGLTVRKG